MSDDLISAEKAQALLDAGPNQLVKFKIYMDLARTVMAQAAENARLREALADAAGALDSAGEELSAFAYERDPWQASHAYESAVQARAALKPEGDTP